MKTMNSGLLFLLFFIFSSMTMQAQPGDCISFFTTDTSACPTLSFTDQSSGGTSTIQSWTWTFGDGGFATGPNPSHTYSVAGTYQVCHNIYTQSLCTSTHCDTIVIACLPTSVEGPSFDAAVRLRSHPVTEDRLQLILPEKMAGVLAFEVYDAGGNLLRKWSTVCPAGDCDMDFPVGNGLYMLKITGKNELQQVLRVVKF